MLKPSIAEFNRLSTEKSEIKDCITKYVGYIIATFGAGGLILKYSTEKNPEITTGLLLMIMLIITFYLEVIWHKILSHNQAVGYMQLMAQEQRFYHLNYKYSIILNLNF